METDGLPIAENLEWHENAFSNELRHFHKCINRGIQPDTPGSELIDHLGLVRDIILAHLE